MYNEQYTEATYIIFFDFCMKQSFTIYIHAHAHTHKHKQLTIIFIIYINTIGKRIYASCYLHCEFEVKSILTLEMKGAFQE